MTQFYSNCEQELLHLSGAIQPFGCLLAGSLEQHLISFVSQNSETFIGLQPEQLLGIGLFEWFPNLQPRVGQAVKRKVLTDFWNYNGIPYDAVYQCVDNHWLLEIVQHLEHYAVKESALFNQVKLSRIQDLRQHSQNLVSNIRHLTQFERVLVYQFLDDGSGEVIAEEVSGYEDAYLNLRFPASDVPQIARRLYALNPYRSIPDSHAQPVPIMALYPDKKLDLSYCDLRSVSQVHVDYLNNMQVGASLSFSIVIKERLWGLVACHAQQPTALSLAQKEFCALLVRNYTMMLAAYFAEQNLKFINDADRHADLFKLLFTAINDQERQELLEAIMQLMQATGFIYFHKEQEYAVGEIPRADILHKLLHWATQYAQQEGVYATDRLAEHCPEADSVKDIASGFLFIRPWQHQMHGFAWFRPQWTHVISWAGNPHKSNNEDDLGELRPRSSFKLWQQEMRGRSKPWRTQELMLAKRFRLIAMQAD